MAKRPAIERIAPPCAKYEELKPGAAFNPYQLFTRPSVDRWIQAHPTLTSGAKVLWWYLAEKALHTGFVERGVRKIAEENGTRRSTLQDHLADLRAHGLVNTEGVLGVRNRLQLLWNPDVFTKVIRRGGLSGTPDTPADGTVRYTGQSEIGLSHPPDTVSGTPDTYIRKKGSKGITGGVSLTESRSIVVPPEQSVAPPPAGTRNGPPFGPSWKEEGRRVFQKQDNRPFWKTLPQNARDTRIKAAALAAKFIVDAEKRITDPNPETAVQAWADYHRYFRELSELGFAIEPRRKKTRIQ